MICENCNEFHDGSYASGRFCCSKCAKSFSTRSSRESINKKVSETLKGRTSPFKGTGKNYFIDELRICKKCEVEFNAKRKLQKYCSRACARSHKTEEVRKILRDRANENVKKGLHKGWQLRSIESYPEKFFKKVLKDNNIEFEFNKSIKKRELGINCECNYFLDFYIKKGNIDLEIDGKQHKYREEHDLIRDNALIDNGYKVYRIRWKNINTESGKEYIKNEIEKFLEYYNCPVV